MADNRAIGVFDSGLGGLTVAKEIMKLMPYEKIVYFGDTSRIPYGTKSRQTIKKYAVQDEKFLLSKDVKMIVAACGTVSSVAADTAEQLPVDFIEVVSHSVKDALKATKNKKIGVLATTATIKSGAHKKQILDIEPTATVIENSATLLVPLVEEGWNSPEDELVLETLGRYLEPMKQEGVDTVILGCTHFPVLAKAIQKIMGEDVTLINMGVATARAIKEKLKKTDLLADATLKEHEFFVSDKTAAFSKTASILLGTDFDTTRVETVDVSGL